MSTPEQKPDFTPAIERAESEEVGRTMYALISRLYPLCRSMTGDGVRATLRMVQERVGIAIQEVPTGTRVFDWTVPQEWNIRDAYIKGPDGRRRSTSSNRTSMLSATAVRSI